MDHLEPGSIAPEFELLTPEGAPLNLTDSIRSGPLALVFYKSSCSTCQFTFPFIQKMFQGLTSDSQPRIWGISQDENEETRNFRDEYKLEFPIGVDDHPYAISSAYELRFVPTLYLIDQQRRVRIADFGFSKLALRSIAHELADWLGCVPPSVFSDDDGLPERRPG